MMEWFRSGALDQMLEQLTKEHGTGRYYDQDGNAIDLRPHAFEDFMNRVKPPVKPFVQVLSQNRVQRATTG